MNYKANEREVLILRQFNQKDKEVRNKGTKNNPCEKISLKLSHLAFF